MEDLTVRELIAVFTGKCSLWNPAAIADELLKSPDLRVEIVEPKYKVWASNGDWEVSGGRFNGRWGAKFQVKEYADEYCDWLNSREDLTHDPHD